MAISRAFSFVPGIPGEDSWKCVAWRYAPRTTTENEATESFGFGESSNSKGEGGKYKTSFELVAIFHVTLIDTQSS